MIFNSTKRILYTETIPRIYPGTRYIDIQQNESNIKESIFCSLAYLVKNTDSRLHKNIMYRVCLSKR
jgi:hypothetical protein